MNPAPAAHARHLMSARSPKQSVYQSAAPSRPPGATLFCVLINPTSLFWRIPRPAVGSNAAAAASTALQNASNCPQKRSGGSLSSAPNPPTQDGTEPQIPKQGGRVSGFIQSGFSEVAQPRAEPLSMRDLTETSRFRLG